MQRKYNFGAGPATLPQAVMEQVQNELLDWQGKGISVMELGHRTSEFNELILTPALNELKALMSIPDNYKILFITSGASAQFSMVPLNLLQNKTQADYLYTGIWSHKAMAEAKRYCQVNIALNAEANGFTAIPPSSEMTFSADAAYVHYTPNETINGSEFHWIPETNKVPLVADMSSNILSRSVDVSRYGIIYAGAQKNIGPAGLTIAIVRDDLIGKALPVTPTLYNYKTYADNNSLYNTPATFSIYMAGLVFKWLRSQGGVAAMAEINQRKANKLYQLIDASAGFYSNNIDKSCRSRMNVVFKLPNDNLQQLFLKESAAAGLLYLKGHKAVGGIRASIYNAMTEKGVDALVEFMKDFMKGNG